MKLPANTSSEIAPAVDTRSAEEKEADRIAAEQARDEAGATLVKVDGEGAIVANGAVVTPSDLPVLEGDPADWTDVLIVANGADRMPPKKDRKVIVVEARSQPDEAGQGGGAFVPDAVYPKTADAYLGWAQVDETGAERQIFPDVSAPVFIVGKNLIQFGLGGLSRKAGYVSVGPAHPIYAAVNLAHLQGAKTVEIVGMTDHDKAVVGPYLDKIKDEFETLSY